MGQLVANLITHEQLVEITRREVERYAAYSFTSESYTLLDEGQKRYAVVDVPNLPRPYSSQIVVMAQVMGEKVIIIEDITDKPLYEALMVNGKVPRQQIVLVYAGETVEETQERATDE
jgi:hypothetical protein